MTWSVGVGGDDGGAPNGANRAASQADVGPGDDVNHVIYDPLGSLMGCWRVGRIPQLLLPLPSTLLTSSLDRPHDHNLWSMFLSGWWNTWVPPMEDRRVFDFSMTKDGWQLQVPSLLMLLEAYFLLRVPNSRVPRFAIAIAVWGVYLYSLTQFRVHIPVEGMGRGGQPALFGLFWCMMVAVQMIRAAHWAILRDGTSLTSAIRPSSKTFKFSPGIDLLPSKPSISPEWDLMLNIRAVSRGPRMYQECQADGRPFWSTKLRFVFRRATYGLGCLALVDLVDCILKCPLVYPPAPRAQPGSIWLARAGAFGWAGPYFLALCVSVAINMLVQGIFSLMSAGYALVHPNPDVYQWSPLPVYRLGCATSLSRLWSKHWHQQLRQVFLFAAQIGSAVSLPLLGKQAARAVGVLSAFALSGLAHEIGQLYMRSPGYPSQAVGPTFLFFFGQGWLVLGEQLFTAVTGKAVRGFRGWLWTNVSLLVLGTAGPMDIWFRYGLGTSSFSFRLLQPIVDQAVLWYITHT